MKRIAYSREGGPKKVLSFIYPKRKPGNKGEQDWEYPGDAEFVKTTFGSVGKRQV